jgi:hypothetical protein
MVVDGYRRFGPSMAGGINHAGTLRPATPFHPDGCWGYIKGNGVPLCFKSMGNGQIPQEYSPGLGRQG